MFVHLVRLVSCDMDSSSNLPCLGLYRWMRRLHASRPFSLVLSTSASASPVVRTERSSYSSPSASMMSGSEPEMRFRTLGAVRSSCGSSAHSIAARKPLRLTLHHVRTLLAQGLTSSDSLPA